jgi:hypothetical protein
MSLRGHEVSCPGGEPGAQRVDFACSARHAGLCSCHSKGGPRDACA